MLTVVTRASFVHSFTCSHHAKKGYGQPREIANATHLKRPCPNLLSKLYESLRCFFESSETVFVLHRWIYTAVQPSNAAPLDMEYRRLARRSILTMRLHRRPASST
jgi:hypothetical protein